MAIAYRGQTTVVTSSNGGSLTADLTGISGLATGDLVIFAAVDPVASDMDMASAIGNTGTGGWTPVADLFQNNTFPTNLGVWVKFMEASVDTSVTFVGSASAQSGGACVAMAFSGVDMTRPFDVLPVTAVGDATVLANPPSINTVTAGVVDVICVGGAHARGAAVVYTMPTGYTTNAISGSGNDTNDGIVGMGYNTSPSDPEDPGAVTFSGVDAGNYTWAACTIALRPAETSGIHLVGSAVGNTNNGGDITLTLPAGIAQNDLVIVAHVIPRLSDIDVGMTTSGYTEVADLYADDSLDTNLGVFYKKMGASPDATAVTAGGGDSLDGNSAVALVFRNVDTTTPMDVTATTNSGNNTMRANPPSINQADANTVIVVAAGGGHNLGIGTNFNMPMNYIGVSSLGDDNRDSSVALAYAHAGLVSDPEDPGTFSQAATTAGTSPVNTSTSSWAAVTMALRAAVAPSGQLHIWVGIIGL